MDLTFDFYFQNATLSSDNVTAFFNLQVKSKSATGSQVGATNGVVFVNFPHAYQQLIYVSGNHLAELDNSGGVADNSSGTGQGAINGVYYDSINDRTYLLVANISQTFSTGETLYFSPFRFASAGTWVSNNGADVIQVSLPAGDTQQMRHVVADTFGATTTATEFRATARMAASYTGVTTKISRFQGTMELVS